MPITQSSDERNCNNAMGQHRPEKGVCKDVREAGSAVMRNSEANRQAQ